MKEPAFGVGKGMTPGNPTIAALHLTILLGRNKDKRGQKVMRASAAQSMTGKFIAPLKPPSTWPSGPPWPSPSRSI